MIIVDVNILLYSVNQTAVQHARVHQWLEDSLNGDEPIGLSWVTLLGFIRVATNARTHPAPLSIADALERVESWIEHANTVLISELSNHLSILSQLLNEVGTAANLTTDAHLAALAIEYDATLASCDKDFAKFRQVRWINPAEAQS